MDNKHTITKISKDTLEVTITIPSDSFTKSYNTLLKAEASKTSVKGFRKGQTPTEMIEVSMKPELLFNTFQRLAPYYVERVVVEEKIELVATPEYKEMPKLEKEKDISFTVILTIMPEFKLGDMKKVKVKVEKSEVEDKDVDEIIKKLEENKNIKAKKGTKAWVMEAAKVIMLEKVETIEELKKQIKDILQEEKTKIAQRNAENDALNQAIKLSKIEVPDKAVHFEAHERENSFMHNLESIKMTIEQYANAQGTSVEQLREMWHKDAREALETDVFLKMYASENKIDITEQELQTEIEKIKSQNKGDASLYENPQWIEYIKRVVLKQRAYEKFMEVVMPKKK